MHRISPQSEKQQRAATNLLANLVDLVLDEMPRGNSVKSDFNLSLVEISWKIYCSLQIGAPIAK